MQDRTYCVYILASRSRNLYTGVTNNLERRMIEHREGLVPGFTSKYNIFRLVHFEVFGDIRYAIAREKEIKGWRREKKLWLIQKTNPRWADLAAEFFERRKRETALYGKPNMARAPEREKPTSHEDKPGNTTEADPSPPSAKTARLGSG